MFQLEHKFYDKIEDILGKDTYFVDFKKGIHYLNASCTFDIEVSSFLEGTEKRATMYAFVLGINGRCVLGRTWQDFLHYLGVIRNYYVLNDKCLMIIYVHNLSYEFQFIKDMFKWKSILALEPRKVITATSEEGFEFRCSYLLSGLSLAKLGENLIKYPVHKMVGDLDYSLIRHSKTPLTDKELGYILNDGLVVMSYIEEEIERLGGINKIPYTKTGYVRNLCRDNCFKDDNGKSYHSLMKNLTLSADSYTRIRQAYHGGFTHASIFKINKTWENVASYDFTSSYPSVMLSEQFPMSRPYYKKVNSYEEFRRDLDNYCCFFSISFYNIRLKEEYKWESFISEHKCLELEGGVKDNGRIRKANKVSLVITEVDYKIIEKIYDFDEIEISNFFYFIKGYLPLEIINTTIDLYKKKTELKGVEGKEQEYMVSKGMLNSLYGMCVTDIVRNEFKYVDGEWITETLNLDEAIYKYNKGYSRFLFYGWGVWISAYACFNVWDGITEFKEDYIYADTDSLKVLNYEKHLDYIERYNKNIIEKVNKCLNFYNLPLDSVLPKNKKGIPQPIGVWSFEGVYDKFKTLGAKRYLTEKDGEISITISGVAKKQGADYLKWKYKTNDNIFKHFNNRLVFPSSYDKDNKSATGKQTLTYIDIATRGVVKDYLGVEGKYADLSSVYMEGCSYELSIEIQYMNLFFELLAKYNIKKPSD